jgi:hypothetical protein
MNERRRRTCNETVRYTESPIDSPKDRRKSVATKTPKKKKTDEEEFNVKPKSTSKSARKATEDDYHETPKKRRSMRPKTPTTKCIEGIALENSPTLQKIDENPGRRKSLRTRRATIHDPSQLSFGDQLSQEEDSPVKINDLNKSNDSNEENKDFNIQRPTTLFDDKEDVAGRSLISFKTPSKQNLNAMIAHITPKTPRHDKGTPKKRLSEIPKTPTSRPLAQDLVKTPTHVRTEMKQSKLDLRFS